MRSAIAALTLSLAGLCFGQITPEERTIQTAFATLRQQPEILLTLDGIDQLGGRTKTFSSNAFFKWDPNVPNGSPARAEINDYLDGVHTKRIVGDGTTLWSYDFKLNAYTSFRYGSYNGGQPEGYRTSLLNELTTASQGPTVFLARAMREIFSGDYAQYRTWLPMAQITVVSDVSGTPVMQDPVIKTRFYRGDQFNFYLVYTYGSRLMRSAAFHFSRTDTSKPWNLTEIYYADRQKLSGSSSRLVDWRMALYSGTLPASTNYVFVPPSTARAIANVRGGG